MNDPPAAAGGIWLNVICGVTNAASIPTYMKFPIGTLAQYSACKQAAVSANGRLLTRAVLLFWALFSNGQMVKTEKNFAVAPPAKGNRPPESGQGENERNEWQHYLLK